MTHWKLAAAAVLGAACCTAAAQQSNTQQNPATQESPAQPAPHGQVLFHRSTSDPSQSDQPAEAAHPAAKVTDEERGAVTYTRYDLDVHLLPQQQTLSAQARITIRNDGPAPLRVVPVQLSSDLKFDGISSAGKRITYGVATLNSDADHTGQLNEAVLELPEPLAPKATLDLEIAYDGTIQASAKRLEQMGTPADAAAHSDWDEISADFVGLRGFGNVVWYPVTAPPALLGDGAKLFQEIARQKQRQSEATIRIRVSAEFYDIAPTLAVLNGHPVAIDKPEAAPSETAPGVVTASYGPVPMGFAVPSLFLTTDKARTEDGLHIYTRTEDQPNAQNYVNAAAAVRPLVEQWLGQKQREPLTILDLPEAGDAAFEQGSLLATSVDNTPFEKLEPQVAHGLAHTYFTSPREWLNEGVPNFVESLWIEHTQSRDLALASLEQQRGALSFAEPASPGAGGGESLLDATDPVYFRTKATYVLWMLRDNTTDKQLSNALTDYRPSEDTSPEYFEKLTERSDGFDPAQDLQWLFANWVNADRGLPDLSIAAVHPSPVAQAGGQYLVGIDIQNDGYTEAEVPVTVISAKGTLTERVRLPGKTLTTHRMLVQGTPQKIVVNDGAVPELQSTVHTQDLTGAPQQ
ncbi:hypothetical protein [Silvibacterium dinghuense]|uniref:Peptidase M1 membrane alanine aminopeptidase domain-containing protein n=1 Tax=Silvibacterium dinghuense TaxID=1560006 RepID=A0A4Q1S8Y3_9BACT|nr:hypothetical protein [Silvibacterium dinghuense]RXS93442.1 hypothetical protein ESZ00_19065 [Silvibacterium dinghuense]GGH05839.1 hypothetical protein GCM10011586_22570 [Silvibacterium dinghuense]